MLLTLLRSRTAATAKWRTRSGIRRTSPTDTLSVDVECYTDPRPPSVAGGPEEGGIDRVEFTIVENGVATSTKTVSAPELRTPNFSEADSPLPGVTSGMAPLWCYGTTLECSALAAGTIEVTAVVYSNSGTATAVAGSVVLYNDKDGVDRRPSTKLIYISPFGNDGNAGTAGSPKKTIMAGLLACRSNPGGSTSADMDCGGAELVLMPGAHTWAGGIWGAGSWHTSGARWLTITSQSGATMTRDTTAPEVYLTCSGYAGGGQCRVRFVNPVFVGLAGIVYVVSGVAAHIWIDGGESGSASYDAGTPWSVRYLDDSSQPIAFDGSSTTSKRYATCHTRRGVVFGFSGWTDLQDCRIKDYTGIAMQSSGDEDGNSVCNALVERQRNGIGDCAGFGDVTGGALFSVSVPVAGTMRVAATASVGSAFDTHFAGLVGSTTIGVVASGFTSGGNNGAFFVTATGTSAGLPWVEMTNASAVAEVGGAAARILTGRVSDSSPYTTLVHPDVHQWNSDRTETMHTFVAVRDVTNSQSWFTGGHDLIRCVLFNVSGGDSANVCNFNSSSFTNCLFAHNDFAGPWDFSGSPDTYTGTCVHDNVMGTTSSNYPSTSFALNTHNHFESGTPYGTSAGTGSWYDADPDISPWWLTPAPANVGTASGLLDCPPEWMWAGADTPSRGVWRNIGTCNWSLSAAIDCSADLTAMSWAPMSSTTVRAIIATSGLPARSWTVPVEEATSSILAAVAFPAGAWATLSSAAVYGSLVGIALPAASWTAVEIGTAEPATGGVDLPALSWVGVGMDTVIIIPIPRAQAGRSPRFPERRQHFADRRTASSERRPAMRLRSDRRGR